jgi:RES domain-containing protein
MAASNPRYAEFHQILAAHPEWLRPWNGTLFRFQTINYPSPKDIVSGDGAKRRGGRWNPPGLLAVYGSDTDSTALEECKANDRYYGIVTKAPRILVAVDAKVARMLDLTEVGIRRILNITLRELAAEDRRKLNHSGQESQSRAIGRAAANVGASGLLARSTTVHQGIKGVVFPGAHRQDRLPVVEGNKLAKLGFKQRA